MKYYELNKEEEKVLKDFEGGRLVSAGDIDKKNKLYRRYAKGSLNKTRNINIRISEGDLQKLKVKAIKVGIPYQTLAASILHQSTSE